MSRYRPTHSARERERRRSERVDRLSRQWAVVAGVALAAIVALVILTTGGWEEAVRTFSGDELKERESELRSQFESATPDATASIESTLP